MLLAFLLGWLAWSLSHPPRPLAIAINPWPGYEYATLAARKGFFAEEGVEVRLVEQYSLNDTRQAFDRGQVDGFFGTMVEVLKSRDHRQRSAQVVLVADYSCGADSILASPDVVDLADLKGKRVGFEAGTVSEYLLARGLESAGLTWTDIRCVNTAALNLPDLFRRGEIDAVVAYPPVAEEIVRCGGHSIFDSSRLPNEIVDVLAVDESIVASRPKEVRAFLRAYHRAQRYAVEHPAEANRIMASREGIPAEAFQSQLEEGVRLLGAEDQAEFLGPKGRLKAVAAATEAALRKSGTLRRDHSPERLFVDLEANR